MSTISVVAAHYGGPDVLDVVPVENPSPATGQVVVQTRAVGVNPIDWKLYSGDLGSDEDSLPIHVGAEAAGVVTAVGDGVDGVAVGDEVIVYPASGTYASVVAVDASAVVPKPAGLDWPQAAGLLLAGATATHALTTARVGSGDTVLVHGAAGGVGLMAVQLAVDLGARVVATASERNHALLRELGATPVTYGEGLTDRVRAAAPGGVVAALDLVGTDEAVDVSLELVPDHGRIVTIAAFGRAGGPDGIVAIGGGPGADPGTELRRRVRGDLAAQAADGHLRVLIARTFPLADAAQAHRYGRQGHTVGKIVLIP